MKISFLDTQTLGNVPNLKILEQFGEVIYYQNTAPEQIRERLQEVEIAVTNKVVFDRGTIESAPALKLICVAATGTNNIDKAAAEAKGIPVKNVAGYSTHSVAQVTFALLLQLINKVPYYNNYVKQGGYSESPIFTHLEKPFWELHGKRFGIIGLGTIGRQVASIAQAFGAEVIYYSASGQNNNQPYLQVDLEELLSMADIVSIHAPLTNKTADLLNYDRLQQMKPSAYLINVGRGGIVQEADLAKALNEGIIAGAGIDVFATEPIKADNPLLQVKNPDRLVLTPHIAWSSLEARTLLMEKIAQNIQEYISSTT